MFLVQYNIRVEYKVGANSLLEKIEIMGRSLRGPLPIAKFGRVCSQEARSVAHRCRNRIIHRTEALVLISPLLS
jgi:hypothetical protein